MAVRFKADRAQWVFRYGLAVLAAMAAMLARMSLHPLLQNRSPLMLAALAVMVSAWYGGLKPGLFTGAICAGVYFFHGGPISRGLRAGQLASYIELAMFLMVGIGIGLLAESLHRMSRRSKAAAEKVRLLGSHLERHVKELEQKQVALREAVASAEAANRAKDHFLAMISHELRSPLTPVLLSAEELAANSLLPEQAREEARLIRESALLEARLIDDLLDLTRIARGKLALEKRPMDVHLPLRAALAMCQEEIKRKRFSLNVDLLAEHSCIDGDSARIHQIVFNVLRNAVKFTPEGGSITIRTRNLASLDETGTPRLIIEMIDSGIGIDPDVLPRLFTAFEQGEPSIRRQFGGLGLGLSICRMLVEAHDGTICASSPGKYKGATFTIELPTTHLPAQQQAEPPLHTSPNAHSADRKSRILLIEDHAQTNKILCMLLATLGHDVRPATNGMAARQLAENENFDLVVSDVSLPDISGLDLMKELKTKYGLRGIAISGYGGDDAIQQSRAAGFAQHLTKPITAHQIEAAIANSNGVGPLT